MALDRVYNFSAGPAVLPEEVLKEAADEMLNYRGCGMSVMEMSHRSSDFQQIIDEAERDLRDLLGGHCILLKEGIHVKAIALLARHASCRGVRLLKIPESLKLCHLISDGRGGAGQLFAFGNILRAHGLTAVDMCFHNGF